MKQTEDCPKCGKLVAGKPVFGGTTYFSCRRSSGGCGHTWQRQDRDDAKA